MCTISSESKEKMLDVVDFVNRTFGVKGVNGENLVYETASRAELIDY